MTDKQIIIDENEINPNDWLEPYKPIPACEIKDCEHWVYAGNNVYGCRIAEDGLVCDDFNNDDECCMYRQLEYYKEALKAKEQECEELKEEIKTNGFGCFNIEMSEQLDQLKAENEKLDTENKRLVAELANPVFDSFEELDKLKATLTEIKEICNNNDELKGDFNLVDCDKYKLGKHNLANKILQKISEVEDEYNGWL